MTISCYSGLPGSGKSYGVVEHVVIPALKQGRTIRTNIPLNVEHLETFIPGSIEKIIQFTNDEIKESGYLGNIAGGEIIIIDECWRLWPTGLKASQVPEEQKAFLAEHRHKVGQGGESQEVILVTQDAAQIAAFARQLIEKTFRAQKLDKVGAKGKYRIDVYQGAITGQSPGGERMREIFGTYKEKVWLCYSSHTKSETGQAGQEATIDSRASALKSAAIAFGIPLGLVFMVAGAWAGFDTLLHIGGKQPEEPEYKLSSNRIGIDANKHNVNAAGDEKNSPNVSHSWRLVAYIESEETEKKRAWIKGRSGLREIDPASCYIAKNTQSVECLVDGERVATWSGVTMARFGNTAIEKPGI